MINVFCEVHNGTYRGEIKEKKGKMLLCSSYFPSNNKTYV